MGLPIIRADLLNVGNVHNQESTDADIDKYKDSSYIKPHPVDSLVVPTGDVEVCIVEHSY